MVCKESQLLKFFWIEKNNPKRTGKKDKTNDERIRKL